jgi:hypothetical protein
MASRQAEHNRQRDVVRLREKAEPAPIVVGYDNDINKYVVRWTEDYDTVLCAGRHEVVAAFIDGFVRAWINRPLSTVDAPPPLPDENYIVVVVCTDQGCYYLATRQVFATRAEAETYLLGVADSRHPLVIAGRFGQLRLPTGPRCARCKQQRDHPFHAPIGIFGREMETHVFVAEEN